MKDTHCHALHEDLSELANTLFCLREFLSSLEEKYGPENVQLAERLAGQMIRDMNRDFLVVYRQALIIEYLLNE